MSQSSSTPLTSVRVLAQAMVWPVVMFPVWWYGRGLVNASRFALHELAVWGQRLSLRLLVRNMFRPMYGDYSKSGRAISLFFRLLTFFVRLLMFVIWVVLVVAVMVLYLVFPLAVVWQLIATLQGL